MFAVRPGRDVQRGCYALSVRAFSSFAECLVGKRPEPEQVGNRGALGGEPPGQASEGHTPEQYPAPPPAPSPLDPLSEWQLIYFWVP